MGDRIAVLRAGELQQIGPPRAIYQDPENLFVASFLGTPSINQIEVTAEDGRYQADGVSLPLPAGIDPPARAVAGVRPEHLRVLAAGESAPVELEGRVTVVEPLGAETFLYLDLGSARLRARAPGFAAAAPGDAVRLGVDPAAILWFDAATGKRLGRTAA